MSTKQVIVIRRDLNMRTGKMIAQGAHASMAFLTKDCDIFRDNTRESNDVSMVKVITPDAVNWINNSFKKIVVYVQSEQELLEIYDKAVAAGLTTHLITDSGLTEFKGEPTHTCVAIGPNTEERINEITGGLKLL